MIVACIVLWQEDVVPRGRGDDWAYFFRFVRVSIFRGMASLCGVDVRIFSTRRSGGRGERLFLVFTILLL